MPRMSPWRMVVEALNAESIDRVFGLPGNPIHLVDDLHQHSDIRNILARHEHSGVSLAYAYARITGRPAVCYGNPGPGITNMATALLEANSASLPVIALTNGVPMNTDGMGAFRSWTPFRSCDRLPNGRHASSQQRPPPGSCSEPFQSPRMVGLGLCLSTYPPTSPCNRVQCPHTSALWNVTGLDLIQNRLPKRQTESDRPNSP